MFEKKRTSSSLEVKYKLTRGSSRLLHSTLYLDIYNFMTDIFHTLQQTCFLRQLNWAWCEDLLRLIQWDRRGPFPDPQVVHALFWNTFSEYLQENAVEQSHIQWSYSLLLVLPACQLSDKLFCFSSFILEISYWQKKKHKLSACYHTGRFQIRTSLPPWMLPWKGECCKFLPTSGLMLSL